MVGVSLLNYVFFAEFYVFLQTFYLCVLSIFDEIIINTIKTFILS